MTETVALSHALAWDTFSAVASSPKAVVLSKKRKMSSPTGNVPGSPPHKRPTGLMRRPTEGKLVLARIAKVKGQIKEMEARKIVLEAPENQENDDQGGLKSAETLQKYREWRDILVEVLASCQKLASTNMGRSVTMRETLQFCGVPDTMCEVDEDEENFIFYPGKKGSETVPIS
jgi:hypothetical protein